MSVIFNINIHVSDLIPYLAFALVLLLGGLSHRSIGFALTQTTSEDL